MLINERILIGYIKKVTVKIKNYKYRYLNSQPLCAPTNYKFKSYKYQNIFET